MGYLMGIDLGTSSVKVLLADAEGRTKGIGQVGYEVLTPEIGYAEQNPEEWWDCTKQAIRQAFIELLNERPLDKISVKDIAERSTVNRNTFYYYYTDIYALVEEIFQTETQLFMEKLHSYASWEEAFREATAFVSENKRAVHHLFNSGNRNILEHYYHKVTYAAMLSYVRRQAEGLSAAEEDIQALAQFYAAALSGMTADWLRGGMKSNVNYHIDRLGRLLEGNIRQALERSCR